MNIYADRGNLLLLRAPLRVARHRLRARAAPASATPLDPDAHDLFYIGGGQDRDQALCAEDLATVKRDALHAAAARGAVIFAVCGGYQLLGHAYELGGERLPGVGLVDLETVREDGPRLIGNVAIEVDLDGAPRVLAGFENHGGRTRLGAGRAAARPRPAGSRQRRPLRLRGRPRRPARAPSIGTYLHGPLLPKNAWFADWLTATALGPEAGALAPLDDTLEDAAHAAARRRSRR